MHLLVYKRLSGNLQEAAMRKYCCLLVERFNVMMIADLHAQVVCYSLRNSRASRPNNCAASHCSRKVKCYGACMTEIRVYKRLHGAHTLRRLTGLNFEEHKSLISSNEVTFKQ